MAILSRYIKLLLILILFKSINHAYSQDADFSQFYNNKLYLNPAFAGLNKGMRVNSTHRNQWMRVPSMFVTTSISADVQDLNFGGGLGAIFFSGYEGEGYLSTNMAGLFYAYKLILVPRRLEVQTGFQASIVNRSINWSKLEFSDQFDQVDGKIYNSQAIPPDVPSKTFTDANLGGIIRWGPAWKNKNWEFIFGYAMHHFIEPDESILKQEKSIPWKHTIHTSSLIPMANNFISVNTAFQVQSGFQTFNTAMFFIKKPLIVGLGYRNKNFVNVRKSDSGIMYFGFKDLQITESRCQIMYSYDHTVSGLALSTAGSHEISVIFEFDSFLLTKIRSGYARRKKLDCFDFGGGGSFRF